MWKLTIVDDEGTRTVLPLSRGEYNVGRDPDNTVRLTERNISRKHLVLRREGETWTVEDLNSYNGCFVNGLRVSGTHQLNDGDLLQVGDYRLELADEEKAVDEAEAGADAESGGAPAIPRLLDRPDRLVVVDGAAAGTEFALEKDRMILGRAEDADVSINHSSVSRIHAEITRITQGTYEIVDCGSSNGIRVNGVKLDRRVIEDDDEIELGDVRLRFVPRGKIFRPGTVQRGSTSFAPSAAVPSVQSPRRGLGVMVALGAVLGIIVVIAVLVLRPKTDSTAAANSVQQVEDPPVIAEAKKLAAGGDLDSAHAKLNAEIPKGSPLADHSDVKKIEGQWADSLMQRAALEPDLAKRRAMINAVATAPLVDSARRKLAADELLKGDDAGTDIKGLPPVAAYDGGGATAAATGTPDTKTPTTSKDKTAKDKTATTSEAAPEKTAAPTPGGSDVLVDGETKARRALEPRVWSGRATVDEVKMLRAICRHQKDAACVGRCNSILASMPQ